MAAMVGNLAVAQAAMQFRAVSVGPAPPPAPSQRQPQLPVAQPQPPNRPMRSASQGNPPAELLADVRKQRLDERNRTGPSRPSGEGAMPVLGLVEERDTDALSPRQDADIDVNSGGSTEQKNLGGAMAVSPPPQPQWPFWRRKKTTATREARMLTRRVVELGRRKQLEQVDGRGILRHAMVFARKRG